MTRLWRLQIPFKNDSCFVYPSTNRTLLQQGCTGHLGSKPLDTYVYPNVNTSSHFPRLFHFLFLYLPFWILRWVTAATRLLFPVPRSTLPFLVTSHLFCVVSKTTWLYFIWIFFVWQDEPDSEDEDKYADRADMPGQKFDTKRWVHFTWTLKTWAKKI